MDTPEHLDCMQKGGFSMYQVRALSLTKNDLWSNGMIQNIYLNDTETALLFCLGITKEDRWEPLRVQGKIGYVYRSETYAQEICTHLLHTLRSSQSAKSRPQRVSAEELL